MPLDPISISSISFVFGLFIGSFLNVVADRLPTGENFLHGRSHCDDCKHVLNWWELIPVVSFLFLRGKCSTCHKKLSWKYPASELLTGVVFATFATSNVQLISIDWLQFVYVLIFLASLIVITLVDFVDGIIPDEVIGFHVVLFALYIFLRLILHPGAPVLQSALDHLVAAIIAGGFFYGLVWVTKGRGMGGGDVKLAFVMGLVMGGTQTLLAVYLSFLIGGVIAVGLLLGRRKRFGQTVPFGPFLALGSWMALCYGEQLVSLYLTRFAGF